MTKGLLIINAFLDTPQVRGTYDRLLEGAKQAGIDMRLSTNADFFVSLDSGLVKAKPENDLNGTDFILFWNKDVFLGRALERMGYRLFNCADAIEACDNKALTFEMLEGICRMPKTIKVPMTFNTIGYGDLAFEETIGKELGYPYVIKECLGSYGGQVYLAESSEEARKIFKSIEGKDCIAQQFIKSSRGRDIRAYVVGDSVVAAMERYNENDFRSNIANGGKARPHAITAEQEKMAVTAAKGLGLDFAGVDLLLDENSEPLLCEVNSNAQFAALLSTTGINICDALYKHIKASLL